MFETVTETVALTTDQRVRLIELLREQRHAVLNGELTGYGQARDDEVSDIDELIETLNAPA